MPTQPPASSFSEAFQQAKGTLAANDIAPLVQYQTDPEGFFADVLGIPRNTIRWSLNPEYLGHVWDGTPDPLSSMLQGLVSWQNVSVESATTTGKTYGAAGTALWFLGSFKDALVITVAPKEDQLKLNLWKEVGRMWPAFSRRFPRAEYSNLRVRMRPGMDGWSAHGFVAGVKAEEVEGSATKAQGFHAEHMLIIYEEMPGVARAISRAFGNSCRAPHNLQLALGNPDHIHDNLHTFSQGPRTVPIRISAYDHPNVVCKNPSLVPGAVSQQGIDDALMAAQSDGGTENRMFKSRVRGIPPEEATDALIRAEWIKRAQKRWMEKQADGTLRQWGKPALGVDVANSESGDKAATAFGIGHVLLEVVAEQCPDANVYGLKTKLRMETDNVADANCGVDTVGVGAGCFNELVRLKRYVRSLNGGASAEVDVSGQEQYKNLRAQMHWKMREDLRTDAVDLPPNEELARDLVIPTWKSPNRVIIVEGKDEIKAKLGRSPNCFVAGTMVLTPRGQVPIECIRPGDLVTTPMGARRVLHNWQSETTGLTTVRFSNGMALTGRGTHEVFTWDAGFVAMDALVFTNTIESASKARRLAWAIRKWWSTGARSFDFSKRTHAITGLTGTRTRSDYFIGGCGWMPMVARFLTAWRSTIRTTIRSTTAPTIWSWSPLLSTTSYITRPAWRGESETRITSVIPSLFSAPANGTLAPKGSHGTVNTDDASEPISSKRSGCAQLAEGNTWQPSAGSIAVQLVSKHTTARNVWSRLCASFAALRFSVTNTLYRSVVPVAVERSSGENVSVYNLTLDRDNVYYANGILVKNCGDAAIYWNFVRDRTPILSKVPNLPRMIAGEPNAPGIVFDPHPVESDTPNRETYVPGMIGGIARGF